MDDYSQSAGTVSAPLVNENLFRLNCEMIRALIFETQGSPYELGAKSFQTPSVPIDKSYIHSELPFAKKVFKEVFGQLVCPSLNEMNLVRKSFFARNVLLTQTSEHLDLMWQERRVESRHQGPTSVSNVVCYGLLRFGALGDGPEECHADRGEPVHRPLGTPSL